MTIDWGYLPSQALNIIRHREWDNPSRLKARLLGKKEFPIRLGLKPPNGKKAASHMDHYLDFVTAWKNFPHPDMVCWETRRFLRLDEQRLPTFLIIPSIRHLAQLMGKQGILRHRTWEKNMGPILAPMAPSQHRRVYPALVTHLETIENLSEKEAELLAGLIPQLRRGMGCGCYLRALPITGVDTKFMETHLGLIEALMDALHQDAPRHAGGLLNWLDCRPAPRGWLLVRPLCPQSRKSLAGLPILKLSNDVLLDQELTAPHILVVENIQSGLALPVLENTMAVIGGGRNLAWMDAPWLKDKNVGYWGDIDTWGLSFLSHARERIPNLTPLMMDKETLLSHEDRMDRENTPLTIIPPHLTPEEHALFKELNTGVFKSNRLEQERLSADYILEKLHTWLGSIQ